MRKLTTSEFVEQSRAVHGKQHYESIEFFGGQESFEIRLIHDRLKREFCEENNIPLIEVPYWERDNIEKFLMSELDKLETMETKND